ncbi:MAG: oligosaccharide flippase family protein [Candidatus Marithrix sp.]|nr:oligosaccharide flippase family protein [Candidatus Marithrix sp.]
MTSNTDEKQGVSLALLKRLAIRGSVWIIIGFGISQVMRFGGNIVLTRLLSPEAFGIIGTVTAVLIGLEMFSDVGLRPNIIQSQRGEEPAFIRTAWTIQIIRGIILTIAAAAFAYPLAAINNEPILTIIIPVAGLTAIIAGFNSTWLLVYSRRMLLGKLVILDLVSHFFSLVTMMIWALYYPSVWALIAGVFANRIVKVVASHTVLAGTSMKMQWEPKAASELIHFGKWIFISTALGFLVARLDIFVFGSIAGMSSLGIYLLAKNLSRLTVEPLMKLASTILLPMYSRIIEQDTKVLRTQTFKSRAMLLLLFLPPLWAIVLWGNQLIEFLYDDRYHEAGWILRILSAGMLSGSIISTISPVFLAMGDSFRNLINTTNRFILQVLGMIIGTYYAGTTGFIIGVSAAELLCYPLLVYLIRPYKVWLPILDGIAFGSSFIVIWIAFF